MLGSGAHKPGRRVIARAFLMLGVMGCAGDDSLVSVAYRAGPSLTLPMLTITVQDGDRRWTWSAADFPGPQSAPTPTTPERSTRSAGALELTYRFADAAGTVSTGSIALPLRPDWRWGVDLIAATTDPRVGCFGCSGSRAFPIAPAYRSPGRDSLWVVWGGNSISNPVIY